MNATSAASFTRLVRVLAVISIPPALFLPFYEEFLHGGRGAVDIIPRSETYSMVHMLGAFCVLFAMFGLIAMYLRYLEPMGWIGPYSFVLSVLAQGLWAGLLFIDGFFEPLLAHYDPVTQTLQHSFNFFSIVSQRPESLATVGDSPYVAFSMGIIYGIAGALLGIVILRNRFLPIPIGVMFVIGSLLLSVANALPIPVEATGYAFEYFAIAWGAYRAATGDVLRSMSNRAGATHRPEWHRV